MSTPTSPLAKAPVPLNPDQTVINFIHALYRKADFWTTVVVVLYFLLFVIGVVAVFSNQISDGYPWIAVPLAMAAAGLGIDIARHKREAEELQRLVENYPEAGRAFPPPLAEDFRQKLPRDVARTAGPWLEEISQLPEMSVQPPVKSLKRLTERTWFAHHFAAFSAKKLELVFWIMLGISLALLIFSGVTVPASPPGMGAAKCIAATLLFGLSGAALRTWQGLHGFALRCREINQDAVSAGKNPLTDASEVQRLWNEFQLARAGAPLIHPLIRRVTQDHLEDEFQSFCAEGEHWRDPKTGRQLDSLDRE